MTEPESKQPLESTSEIEVSRILDEYLIEVDAGTAVPRDEFLEQHSEHATQLRECLDGLDLISGKSIDAGLPLPFSDFEIRDEIGRGGMGVVYEAHQKSLDRVVALKIMRSGEMHPKTLERFQREAETAAGLHHTNIVPVFGSGRDGDISWYAMQRIDGESLATRIDKSYGSDDPVPVPVDDVVSIGIQTAEALDYAHKRGVVHRDVKPANLIVDQRQVVWLTDFGLARRLVDLGTTATGSLMGTPRYMSPEQTDANSKEVTHYSDIFSLGATLYELAVGLPPFDGDDPLAVIAKIRNEEPISAHLRRGDIPRDLSVVLLKAMSKDPAHRYATASAFAEDLRAVAEGRPIQGRPMSWIESSIRWTRKHEHLARPIGIAVVTTVAAVLLVLSMLSSSRNRDKEQFLIRAGGGPFAASIRSEDSDVPPLHVTVPMQDVRTVRRGNYWLQLAPNGRWSQTVRFHVGGQQTNDFRFRYRGEAKREISIAGSQVVPTEDFDAPAMLIFRGDTVRRLATDSDLDWEADVGSVSASRIVLPSSMDNLTSAKAAGGGATDLVDFRYKQSRFAPWDNRTLEGAPRTATPIRALGTPIDLDGDGRSDTIIASRNDAALLAIDGKGEQIWATRYVFPNAAAALPDEWAEKLVLPGVLDIHNIGDQDDDGVDDLVAQLIRIQPSVQNDVWLAVLSGSSGRLIRAIHCPPIIVPNGSQWPAAGLLSVHDDRNRRSPLTIIPSAIQVVFRRVPNPHRVVAYRANSLDTSFALPLPLQTHVANNSAFAIPVCGGMKSLSLNCPPGKQLGQSTTGVTPYDMPRFAMENDTPLAVLLAKNNESGKDLLQVQDLDGKERWSASLETQSTGWTTQC